MAGPNDGPDGQKIQRKIAIATHGNPRDIKTLSGWPSRITREFERKGVEVVAIDTNVVPSSSRLACYGLYQVWRFRPGNFFSRSRVAEQLKLMTDYTKSDFQRMRIPQARRARYVAEQARANGVRKVLHHVQNSLPFAQSDLQGVEQYLLLDSTWHIESINQNFRNRFTPGIVKAFQQSEKDAFAHVQHFFSVSEYIADDLITYYGIPSDRVSVVGSGWGGIEPFHGDKDYAQGPILCSAKMRFEDKGGQLLIDAFRIARERRPRLQLVVVGQDSYRERFGDIPGLTIYGHIPIEKLRQLFQKSALYAMPAFSEPWGMVYLEALVSRTPILGLRRTAMPEFTDNGRFGFMVDRANPEAVADALVDAMSDTERLRRMGETGQQFVLGRYSWDHLMQKLYEGMQI